MTRRAAEPVRLERCILQLGELHRLQDAGFYHPEFTCVTEEGERVTARMRLHVTEPLDRLVFVDPRGFKDAGVAANSVGSTWLPRRASYDDLDPEHGRGYAAGNTDRRLFKLSAGQIADAIWAEAAERLARPLTTPATRLAVTCHDPQQVGGGNTILFRYLNWLAALGVEPVVYSCGAPPTWCRVEARFRQFPDYESMFRAVEEEVLILYSMWHIEPCLRWARAPRRVWHLRQIAEPWHYGTDWTSIAARKPVIELLEALPIGAITISPHLRAHYRDAFDVDSLLITNGIDLRAFRPGARGVVDGISDSPRPSRTHRVLSVGDPRHAVKGTAVLREALVRLAKRAPRDTWEWTIAGAKQDGPIAWAPQSANQPANQPANLRCEGRSRLTAAQMREAYADADVFVNPSLYEGFGLPSLEAMACGVPVVHADNRGLDEIVRHDENCVLVPVNDAEALADGITRVLSDATLRETIVAGGFATATAHSLAVQFDAFVGAFAQILPGAFTDEARRALRAGLETVAEADPLTRTVTAARHESPLVSVIIPTYNQADYLGAALDSLIAQTYPHWEAVVVNDGSTDRTQEVLDAYARRDPRIRPFMQENRGITKTLNAGLAHARGEYFCWLSSDDLYYPDKLRLQVEAFRDVPPDCALVCGSFDFLQEETGQIDVAPLQTPIMPGAEFPEALKFDFIDGCTAMIRMAALRRVGGFNAQYRHAQDMELWMRLAAYGYRFSSVPAKVTIRRVHVRQSSTTNMIHCRYDAAAMVDFYLRQFHLLEVYRYLDVTRPDRIDAMADHLASRTYHVEANVNHPLLREAFWRWILDGLSALPVEMQQRALTRLLEQFTAHRAEVPLLDRYADWCLKALAAPRVQTPKSIVDLTAASRDVSRAPRADQPFTHALFTYASDLLVNDATPLFAQELTFHGVNKLVDTPYKLAHSALRYLTQFENAYKAAIVPFAALTEIPTTRREAIALFAAINFPDAREAFTTVLAAWEGDDVPHDALAFAEAGVAALSAAGRARLRDACSRMPTAGVLHYWHALTLAEDEGPRAALHEALKARQPGDPARPAAVAWRMATWAAAIGDARTLRRMSDAARIAASASPATTSAAHAGSTQADAARTYADAIDALLTRRGEPVRDDRLPRPPTIANDNDVSIGPHGHATPGVSIDRVTITPLTDGTASLSLACRTAAGSAFDLRVTHPLTHDVAFRTTAPDGRTIDITADHVFAALARPLDAAARSDHAAPGASPLANPSAGTTGGTAARSGHVSTRAAATSAAAGAAATADAATAGATTADPTTTDPTTGVAFTVLNSSVAGGGTAIVYRYANWLTDLGVAVTVYSNEPLPSGYPALRARFVTIADDAERYAAIRERVVVLYSILEWPAFGASGAAAARDVYHLCQGVEDHNYHDGTLAGLRARKPLFELLHALPLKRIVVSPHLARYFRDRFDQRAHVIPNGIDLRLFTPPQRRSKVPWTTITVVGAPERRLKGVDDVVEAVAALARRWADKILRLQVLGGSGRGRVDTSTLPPNVQIQCLAGLNATDMVTRYRASDVVVNAAWYEGFGLPSLEAMACGVPVIQADNSGLDGIVRDGENCVIVPPADPARLAAALERVLTSPELRATLIAGGRSTVADRRAGEGWSLDAQFEACADVFAEILDVRFNASALDRAREAMATAPLDQRLDEWRTENRPLITVIVPTFNQAAFLPHALDSLIAQTYPHWEAIVVNDGSTDDTASVLVDYAAREPRIRVLAKANGGVASALNEGLRHASGGWICWLSSDDLFEPRKLETHIQHIAANPDARAFYTHFKHLDEATQTISEPDLWAPPPPPPQQVIRALLQPFVHGNSIAVHRSIFDEVGLFDPRYRDGQDVDMWLRVASVTPWQFIAERTCITRMHGEQSARQFPEAGALDAARSCAAFLNTHPFPAIFPEMDLSQPTEIRRAVRETLGVAMNPHAMVHRLGYNPALLGRLIEWIATLDPTRLRCVQPELASLARWTQQAPVSETLRAAVDALAAGRKHEGPSVFEPVDPRVIAEAYAAHLDHAGETHEVAIVRRYLAERWCEDGADAPAVAREARPRVATPAPMAAPASALARVNGNGMGGAAVQAFVQPAFRLEGVRTAAIFGAGRYGKVAAELAERCGWRVQYIVDNNKAAWGTRVQGLDVRAPEALLQDRVDLVLVASHAHRDSIAEQLDGMDLIFGRDYIWFLAPIQIGSVQMQVTI